MTPSNELSQSIDRVLRPPRPQHAEVEAAVRGIEDPRAAWELLAARGLIPDDWALGEARGFVSVGDNGLYVSPGGQPRPDVLPHPPTVRACITIASNPDGIVRAEALAQECVQSFSPWHPEEPGGVLWDVAVPEGMSRRPIHVPEGVSSCEAIAQYAVEVRDRAMASERSEAFLAEAAVALQEAQERTGHRLTGLHALMLASSWWTLARTLGLDVPRPEHGTDLWVPRKLARKPFADLPDPLAPLREIWMEGYALSHIGPDAIVLEASRLP